MNVCINGNLELVKNYTSQCSNYNDIIFKKAIELNHIDIIYYFINDKKIDINNKNYLENACWNNNIDLVKLILSQHIKITEVSMTNACKKENIEIINILILHGAIIKKPFVLSYIFKNCDLEIIKQIHKFDFKNNGIVAMMHAINRMDIMAYLISKINSLSNKKSNTYVPYLPLKYNIHGPLYLACSNGNLEMVQLLINSYDNINQAMLNTAFKKSIANGFLEIIRFLKDYVDNNYAIYLQFAVNNGNIDIINYLIENKFNTIKCILTACYYGNLELLKYFLSLGYEIKITDKICSIMNSNFHIIDYIKNNIDNNIIANATLHYEDTLCKDEYNDFLDGLNKYKEHLINKPEIKKLLILHVTPNHFI